MSRMVVRRSTLASSAPTLPGMEQELTFTPPPSLRRHRHTADALTIQNSAAALGFELTLDPRDLARRSTSGRPPLRSAPPPPPAPPAATAARPPMRPAPPTFPDPALNAPDSEARAARGTTTDSTSDPRA